MAEMAPIPSEYIELANECEKMGRPDLAFSARHLGHEYMRKVFTLNEIVDDAREDEQLSYIARVPKRKRFVPTIIKGGEADEEKAYRAWHDRQMAKPFAERNFE